MNLSRKEQKRLHEALLSAFPDESSLRQMVVLNFDKQANALIGGNNLSDKIFSLIEWAESRGKTKALLKAVQTANPDNPKLRKFLARQQNPPHPVLQNYHGWFRTQLEARWAVFFSKLEIPYKYQDQDNATPFL